MKSPVRLPFARFIAVALPFFAIARGAGAEPSLATPSEQAALAAAALADPYGQRGQAETCNR